MTDQTAHDVTGDERRKARNWAEFIESDVTASVGARAAARMILNAMPTPPTLADMTEEERDECRWMQCDVQGQGGAWLIVAPFDDDDEDYAHVVGRQGSKSWGFPAERITPRPDLPRMEWPGTEKPAPAPALPVGWRLADHRDHGRVIVTTPEPDSGGKVAFVRQNDFWDRKYSGDWCKPDELTYIDTEPEADQ